MPMGAVKIGILPSAAHPLMTEVFHKIHLQYPKIQLNIREGQGSELDALLDSGSVDIAILFRYDKPSKSDEILLSTASTYLVSSPGLALTQNETVDLKMLDGVELVLPRKGSHWRSILDESARSQGFQLKSVIEADSLTVQKEIIASNRNLYALLGPFSIDEDLSSGRLKSSKLVNPELVRYVTLATPKYGYLTHASRIVIDVIQSTVLSWNNQLDPTPSALKVLSALVKN
jgi:DNA-binding transcriptional LysR family regulator